MNKIKNFIILPKVDFHCNLINEIYLSENKFVKLEVYKDNIIEQVVFEISNELDIEHIVLFNFKDEFYDLPTLIDRIYYHFPNTKIILITQNNDNIANRFPSKNRGILHILNCSDKTDSLNIILNNKKNININDKRILSSEMTSYTKIESKNSEFSEFKFSGPIPQKNMKIEDTVNYVLSKKRVDGRILLIIPSQENVYGTKIMPAYPPIGLMSIGAILEKAGYYVEIIDLDVDGVSLNDTIAMLNQFDIVGITSVTSTYPDAIKIAKEIKLNYSNMPILLGGIHATVDSIECANEGVFDFIAVGEAEVTVVELVDAILLKETNFKNIKGIVYTDSSGKIISTLARELISNLDDYPLPARHLIKNMDKYTPPDATYLPAAPIMVSRGCPGLCTYCETKNIFGRRTRFRSPKNVIEEIRILVNEYNIKEIHFLDDVITANRKFVLEFCELLKNEPYKLRLEVSNGLRADMVNETILKALKEVGLGSVGFGVETGSERVAEIIKKGITKDQVRKAFAIARELEYDIWSFFIIGLPGDDKDSILETINFAIELNPKYAKFLILKPFPGSEVFYQLDEKNLIDSYKYGDYGVYTPPVHHLNTLSQKEILKLQKYAWRKFYLRPSKILEFIKGVNSFGKFISLIRGGLFVLKRIILK